MPRVEVREGDRAVDALAAGRDEPIARRPTLSPIAATNASCRSARAEDPAHRAHREAVVVRVRDALERGRHAEGELARRGRV